ncbi:hypothetical protein L7F22_031148 [Adiantum nelumboides]|nr:hypothetical protein [Adiantum nelumboides]
MMSTLLPLPFLPHEQALTSLLLGALGCLLLLLLATAPRLSWSKHSSRLPLPPGSFGFPWIGESFSYLSALQTGGPQAFVRRRIAKYGSTIFKTRIFFHNTVIVQGVAANRFIVGAENKQELHNSWPASALAIFGKHAPVAMHGAPHRRLRQIMASCLRPAGLRKLVGRADRMTEQHFATWWGPRAAETAEMSMLEAVSDHTFRVACSLLMRAEEDALVKRLHHHFVLWNRGVMSIPLDVPGMAFHRAKRARRALQREVAEILMRKKKAKESERGVEGEEEEEDLVSLLMAARDEQGSFLNGEELQDVVLFLLFAGHDTATATLCFALKFLEQHPACYQRVVQEHRTIAAQKKPGERLCWADVQNMKYTWMVFQETLRLRPVGDGGIKVAKQDLVFDGYRIPKGWKMFFTMSATHEDEKYFSNPHKFDPMRFDLEKVQEEQINRPPYVFIPFGMGPHTCPGGDFARMTMSLYLYYLVISRFRWKSIDPDEKYHMSLSLELNEGYPATIFLETN